MINRRFIALGAALSLFAAGCAGDKAAPPTAPTPQPFSQTATGALGQDEFASTTFNPTRAGTARLSLSWTGGGNLDLYLTAPACTGNPMNCEILTRSQTNFANPEVITRTVVAGEQFKVWAINRTVTNVSPQNYTLLLTID